jgi:arginyl-tRNA synthetase
MDIVKILEESIKGSLKKMGIRRDDVVIEIPNDSSHGDYSSNIAMQISKELGKNPRETAEEIISGLENTEYVERVEIAGPGFINFYVSDKYLTDVLREIKEGEDKYGEEKTLKGKKIIVEYTDANPFKILHIGHLYDNTIGESLARLLEASGADVKRACYQGDVGLHVAKCLWGLEKILVNDKKSFEELSKESLANRVKYLGDAYMYGYEYYDTKKDSKTIKEIEKLNRYIFSFYLKMPEEDFSELEQCSIKEVYKETRKWCLDYFDTIYKRVGTKFDRLYFESEVGEKGLGIVKENIGKVFEEDDGAVIYRGDPNKGLHTRVFVNQQGIPTYEAKEIGLALLKHEDFEYDESIMVTANEQDGYFKVVLDAFSKIYPDISKNLKHISHGMVKLLGMKKMSSRKGEILSAEWLIDETKKKVLGVMTEKDDELAEKIAVAAIKYAYLKVAVGRDIAFDIDQAISFDGDTGSYLLYVYARCNSILNEVKESGVISESAFENTYTKDLLKQISRYKQVVLNSSQNYSPSTLCQYLFDLGQSFNVFYQNVNVLNSDNREELIPVLEATMQIMKNGLDLLGIKVVEKM